MLHLLTQEKRKKALKLFQYLTKHKIFAVNCDGEIIQNGKTLHESDIVELITHAVENVSYTPIGMKYFYRTLKKNNIPQRYISKKWKEKS